MTMSLSCWEWTATDIAELLAPVLDERLIASQEARPRHWRMMGVWVICVWQRAW